MMLPGLQIVDESIEAKLITSDSNDRLQVSGDPCMHAAACICLAGGASSMMASYTLLAALCEYLRSLAEHFDLRQHIRCNTRLVRLERRSTGDIGTAFASVRRELTGNLASQWLDGPQHRPACPRYAGWGF